MHLLVVWHHLWCHKQKLSTRLHSRWLVSVVSISPWIMSSFETPVDISPRFYLVLFWKDFETCEGANVWMSYRRRHCSATIPVEESRFELCQNQSNTDLEAPQPGLCSPLSISYLSIFTGNFKLISLRRNGKVCKRPTFDSPCISYHADFLYPCTEKEDWSYFFASRWPDRQSLRAEHVSKQRGLLSALQ